VPEGETARRGADTQDPAGSGRGWGKIEVRDARGPTRRKSGVGRARMNSDDCELFKWISNEFDLF
jgi:hypothetical protein